MFSKIVFLHSFSFINIVIFIAILAFVLFLSYRQFSSPIPAKVRATLMFLRVVMVGLVFFFLLEPYQNIPGTKDWVGFLVDTSGSMNVQDSTSGISRLQKVKDFLKTEANEHLKEIHGTRFFEVNDAMDDLEEVNKIEPSEQGSSLVAGVREIESRFSSEEELLSWVLLSDGGATDLPPEGSNPFYDLQIPWITLGVGGKQALQNIRIQKVEIPSHTFAQDVFLIQILWEQTGLEESKTNLRIDLGEGETIEEEVMLSEGSAEVEVRIDEPGIYPIDVYLEPLSKEIMIKDNHVRLWLKVLERKVRVFYVEAFYKNENLFKKALEEDQVFKVNFATSLIAFSKERNVPFVKDPLYGFPQTKASMMSYDVIILSDVARQLLRDDQISWIKELVEERGGAFVMIGGVDSYGDGGYVGTPIEQMLPVEISEKYKQETFLRAKGTVENPFQPVMSLGAHQHPIMRLRRLPEKNQILWETMPMLGGYNYVGRLKPAATALLEHPVDQSQYGARTIMAYQDFGQGRVLAFMSDVTFNWGEWFQAWRGDENEWVFAEFWRDALKYLTQKRLYEKAFALDLILKPWLAEEGKPIAWHIKPHFATTTETQLILEIFQDENLMHSEIFKGERSSEAFVWSLEDLKEGDYQLKVTLIQENQLPKVMQEYFTVHPSLKEFNRLEYDEHFLKQLSDASGGVYLPFEVRHRFPKALEEVRKNRIRNKRMPLWSQFYFYGLLLVLLFSDWFIRKKYGVE